MCEAVPDEVIGSVTSSSYTGIVVSLIDALISGHVFARDSLAVGAPLWFVSRLADETDAEPVGSVGGADCVYVAQTPVVGVAVLDRQPLGRFLIQDLLHGGCYRLAFYCHRDVDPVRWRALSLAIEDGLHFEAAITLASMDP